GRPAVEAAVREALLPRVVRVLDGGQVVVRAQRAGTTGLVGVSAAVVRAVEGGRLQRQPAVEGPGPVRQVLVLQQEVLPGGAGGVLRAVQPDLVDRAAVEQPVDGVAGDGGGREGGGAGGRVAHVRRAALPGVVEVPALPTTADEDPASAVGG